MAVFDPARLAKDRVDERAALRRLARLEQRARLILGFEILWPYLAAALSVLGLMLTLVLIGIFDFLPPVWRGLSLAAGIGAASALVIRGILILRLTREDALERIDADTARAHRPALSLADFSAAHLDDPLTFALWRAHRDTVTREAMRLAVSWPRPRIADRDLYALRFAVLLSCIAALIVTGPEGMRRIDTALIWSSAEEAAIQARLDGWIDPPAYTGLPPILFDFKSQEQTRNLRAPIGSTLVLRRSDDAVALPEASGALTAGASDTANEKRFTLNGSATVSTQNRSIAIDAIPDTPPVITIIGEAQRAQNGSVTLPFRIEDDYGIASGTTRMSNPRRNDLPLIGRHEPLIAAPNQALMPSGDRRGSDGRATFEASENPWAGATVDVVLTVQDDAGQSAESQIVTLRLPERRFTMPVAKSLIEERRRLALDPSTLPRVYESVDLLMTAPDLFSIRTTDYLALREIRTALADAQAPDELRAVIDLMWNVALDIERGGSNDAEQALNAAQEALRQALENGAPDDEIRALTERLKEALNNYLRDYAERAMRQMQQSGSEPQNNESGRAVRPEDLQSMLDRMQDMAQNGARDDAMRMLDALGDILKNLQASRPRLGNPQQGQNQKSLDGLDKMLRDQRGLRDDTYRDGRNNPEAGGELGKRQDGLRGELDKLREGLKGLGQKGQDALGQAGEAMGRAEEALRQGDIPGALREQNKALEGLRAGAQALAQQMQAENGEGQEPGGQEPGGRERSQGEPSGQATGVDPLGRENGANIPQDGTLNENGAGKNAGDRARDVLNELRKRLGEDERTKDERDYYRRLIGPN